MSDVEAAGPELTRVVGHALALAESEVTPRELLAAAIMIGPEAVFAAAARAGLDALRLRLALSEWTLTRRAKRSETTPFSVNTVALLKAALAREQPTLALLGAMFAPFTDAQPDPTSATIRALRLG